MSIGTAAPDFFAKLINPKRDKNLVGIWCESVDRAKILPYGKRGEFWLRSEFVEAYCWELSLDSVDAKPAEAEDEAVPAPVAEDAKPAEAEDEAEPAPVAEGAKPDEPAAVAEDDFETLHGLRMRRVEGDWYEPDLGRLRGGPEDPDPQAEGPDLRRVQAEAGGGTGGPPSSSRSDGIPASSGCPRVGAPCFRKRPRRECA